MFFVVRVLHSGCCYTWKWEIKTWVLCRVWWFSLQSSFSFWKHNGSLWTTVVRKYSCDNKRLSL